MGLSVAGMRASRRCLLTRKLANPPYVSKDIEMSRPVKLSANPNWRGGKSSKDGYATTKLIGHPRADPKGYVKSHILLAEKILGKSLPDGVVVHHTDCVRGKVDPLGIVICPDDTYHRLLHRRTKAFDACGNADWRRCNFCKQYDSPENLIFDSFSHALHRECRRIKEKCQRRDALTTVC